MFYINYKSIRVYFEKKFIMETKIGSIPAYVYSTDYE